MAYNTDLPPVIRRTNQTDGSNADEWVLETASGNTIQTYTRVGMSIDVWWEDCIDYIADNASSTEAAVKDITLLLAKREWTVEA